jgi:hypothetical protein
VAEFLTFHIDISDKAQKDIASEIGYDKPNVLTMIKQGKTKLPLTKIGPIAKAIDADPAYLLRLALTEYVPETWSAIEGLLPGELLTANERKLIEEFRKLSNDTDPAPIVVEEFGGAVIKVICPDLAAARATRHGKSR